jgi:hypothetical protein
VKSVSIVLIISGVFIAYAVVHGRLGSSSSSSGSSSSVGGGGGGSPRPGSDLAKALLPGPGGEGGVFQAIDQSGTVTGTPGATYTLGGSYASLTDSQKGDVNAWAHANTG